MRGIDDINNKRVPTINGTDNFSLEQYQNRDNSRAKRKAAAWGAGDFKSVLRQNMDLYCDDYAVKVPQSIKIPTNHRQELYEPSTEREEQEKEEGEDNGLQQRLF